MEDEGASACHVRRRDGSWPSVRSGKEVQRLVGRHGGRLGLAPSSIPSTRWRGGKAKENSHSQGWANQLQPSCSSVKAI